MASARGLVVAAPAVLLLVFACGDSNPSVDADAGTDAAAPMTDASGDVVTSDAPSCNGAADQITCGGTCVDPASDHRHCGACEHACAADERCTAGACKPVCRIGGAVYAADAVDPTNGCRRCSPASSSTAWTPSADGSTCGATGVCVNAVCSDGCYVGGAFIAAGSADPANPCQRCDTATSTDAWTPFADGTTCGAGHVCSANSCMDGCHIAGAFVAPDGANPTNACQRCAPSTAPDAWSARSDGTSCAAGSVCTGGVCQAGCFIGGTYYASGAVDPANACQVCTPATSTTAWTPRPAGTACGAGSVCSGGTCNAGCYIDGSYRASATLDPSNDCRACNPASSTTTWSVRPNNSTCGTAQFCTAGACGPTWHGLTPNGLTPFYGGAAAAGANGRIYLFGGVPVNVPTALMQWYDPATNTFTRGADVPYVSYRACAVTALNGKIYVMGGSPTGAPITNVVIYDPATNSYTNGPPMPFAADEDGCALGAGGKIFVFSADLPAAPPPALYTTARTMILDTVTGTWTTGAPMPTPRQRVTAVTLPNGRIAVTGGNRGYIPGEASAVNELYDPATNSWTTGAPMPAVGYWQVAALRADGRMVVGSGLPFSGTWTATYVYDPTLNTWATGLPTTAGHYAGYAASTPDGRVYFLTGRTEGGGLTSVVDALY